MYIHFTKHKVNQIISIFRLVKEDLLYNIWKYKLYDLRELKTNQGEEVDVQYAGEYNTHSGPDFSNARIKIGNTVWAGHIEIHVKTSDWFMHKHEQNNAYKTVILHVVYEHDIDIDNSIPILELKNRISSNTINAYINIIEDKHPIPCHALIKYADHFIWLNWLDRLTAERLQSKIESLQNLLIKNKQHWEEAFYQMLAHYLGGKVNNEAMSQLAEHLPLGVLVKHKHEIKQVEALMFGIAGFLSETIDDVYHSELVKEFKFLQAKYSLNTINVSVWKYLRMRPANFPTIRIAQLAMLVHQSSHLLSKLIETKDINIALKFFDVTPSPYWDNHYRFGEQTVKKKKALGRTTTNALMINTIIPILFYYGRINQMPHIEEKAIQWLSMLPAETNRIIELWEQLGKKPATASDSQAMLHLYHNYCKSKQCLNCAVGIALLSGKAI